MSYDLLKVLAVALLGYFVLKVVYQIWFHPLSHVPGPWYCAVGDIWNEWQQMKLVHSRSLDKLMQKYGPVVRIAANKVYNTRPISVEERGSDCVLLHRSSSLTRMP